MDDYIRETVYNAFSSLDSIVQEQFYSNGFYSDLMLIIEDPPVSSFLECTSYLLDNYLSDKREVLKYRVYAQYELALISLSDFFVKHDSVMHHSTTLLNDYFTGVKKALETAQSLSEVFKKSDVTSLELQDLYSLRDFLSAILSHEKQIKQGLRYLRKLFFASDQELEGYEEFLKNLKSYENALANKEVSRAELVANYIYEKKGRFGLEDDELKDSLLTIAGKYIYLKKIPETQEKYEHLIKKLNNF